MDAIENIYLDNNVLIELIEKESTEADKVKEPFKLKSIRLILSAPSIWEIAKSFPVQARQLAASVDKLEPFFLLDVRSLEIKRFVYGYFYNQDLNPFNPFSQNLLKVMTSLPNQRKYSCLELTAKMVNINK